MRCEDGSRRPRRQPLDDSFLFTDPMSIGGVDEEVGHEVWACMEADGSGHSVATGCGRERGIALPVWALLVVAAATLGALAGATAPTMRERSSLADPALLVCPQFHSDALEPGIIEEDESKTLIHG